MMQWGKHLQRVFITLVGTSALLALLMSLFRTTSNLNEFKTWSKENYEWSLISDNMLTHGRTDPCLQTPMLEWATKEFGLQGCWVVQKYGQQGLRVLLTLEQSEEFRKLFNELGPNRLIPLLGHTLSHPQEFNLLITEDKARDVVAAPLQAAKKRFDAGKQAWKEGRGISETARAVSKSSGVAEITLHNVKKQYTPEETLVLLLHLIDQGQGRFLDQFHMTRNDQGEVEKIEIQYVQHGLHITSAFLLDGLFNFEKKYRWEQVNPNDIGWALMDVAMFVAPIYKVAKIGKLAKVTKTPRVIATVAKTEKIAHAAKITKVIRMTAVLGTGVYVVLHPWQTLSIVSDIGTQLLSWMAPQWIASIFGPFLGILLTLTFIYLLAWPLIETYKIVKLVATIALTPLKVLIRWLYPRPA